METNPITDFHKEVREQIVDTVDFTDHRLVEIIRLRLVTDPGFPMYDLSYCYGVLADGRYVRVDLPRFQFDKRNLTGDLIAMCREAGVYGKKLGLFNPEVISILR